jgi:hypothetical protein
MWPRREWLAAADPGGSNVDTPACGHRCTAPNSETNRAPKCSVNCAGEGDGGAGGPRRRRIPRRLGDWPTRETTSDSPGCWAREGAQVRGGDRRARPSPAWARRRRRGGGVGDLSRAGVRERVSNSVRGQCARPVTTTAERGLAVTGRRSRVHGEARLDAMDDGEHGTCGRFVKVRVGSRWWQGAFGATKDMVPFFLPYSRRCTRLSATARPRRCGPA